MTGSDVSGTDGPGSMTGSDVSGTDGPGSTTGITPTGITATGITATGITATALGTWPGTDASEANRIVRGELGSPNLPHLVELPNRGVGADAVGRMSI